MPTPEIPSRSPAKVTLEAGKTYWWCACGRSQSQPFCDGSHKGSEFTPHKLENEEDRTVWLCRCKQTGNQPFCDGSHHRLPRDPSAPDDGEQSY